MPTVATPTANFNLDIPKDNSKMGYIFLVYIYRLEGKRVRVKYSTKRKVDVKYWSTEKQRPIFTKKYLDHPELNNFLNDLSKIAQTIFIKNPNLTAKEFKLELDYDLGRKKRPVNGKLPITFFEFIDQYIKDKIKTGGERKRNTWKKFITVQNHLKAYAKEKKKKVDYDNIDWHFRKDFLNWLYAEPRNHAINNASKIFEVIKQFMQESYKLRYHDNKTFDEKGFGVKRVKTNNKVRLDFEELNQLRFLKLDNTMLDKARDLFIVGCYTGLRFSDWHKVNKENIKIKEDTELLEILTTKTNQRVYIPCLPELKTILKKYNYQLPTLSAQKFNDSIKEVCRLAAIDTKFLRIYSEGGTVDNERIEKWKKVSSHAARRSFASNFYNLEIPPFILMQITGHTTEKQFFEYIDVDQEKLALKFAKIAAMNAKKRHLKVI